MFFGLITGSAGFAQVFLAGEGCPQEALPIGPWIGLAGFVAMTIDVIWSPSVAERDHEKLCRRFSQLKRKMERAADPSDEDLRSWKVERSEIEEDEDGSPFWALELDCYNETQRAWGRTDKVRKLGWWCRITKNYLHHDHLE